MVPLAYAAVADFILSFDGDDNGGFAFNDARGIAVNSTHIFVADLATDSVQIFDSSGNFVLMFGFGVDASSTNSFQICTSSCTAGLQGSGLGQFSFPSGIAVNSTHIFVSDQTNDDVQIFNLSGGIEATFGSTGTGDGDFTAARGIVVNATHILVADSSNDDVQIFNLSGGFEQSISVNNPTDVAFDSNGRIIVAAEDDTISIFNPSGGSITTFGGTGSAEGQFDTPEGLDVDSSDRIIVADTGNARVQIFDSSGSFVTMFGFGVDDNTAVFQTCTSSCQFGIAGSGDGQFNDNRGLAVDSNNRILAIEAANDQVQIYEGFPISTPATSSSGGSSDQQWKSKPTFGLSHQTFRPLVDGGFSFNGKSHDITDNWWTPFAEQKVKIGTTNTFTAKAYADKQLRIQEFLFGIPEVGDAHKAELGVEIVYDYSGEIEMINVVQKTDIIDIDSIKVVHTKSKCQSDDTVKRCDTTRLSMKFLEPLKDKIMALKGVDFKGRVHITYLNEGFDISGNSLNPMNTMMIIGTEKHEGLIEVTQTAKYSNFWTTQDDREFEMNEYGSFKQINQIFENDSNLMDKRFSSDFADYKKSLADKYAKLLLESCPNCFTSFADFDDSFAYEIPETVDRIEIISHLIEIEKQRAIQVLIDAQLDITYPDVEIDLDDRPISVILAEERAMKKILADERAYLKQVLAPQQ